MSDSHNATNILYKQVVYPCLVKLYTCSVVFWIFIYR